MKKTILAAALVAFVAGSASAADLVTSDPNLPGVVFNEYAPKNYVGGTVGQRLGDDRHTSVGVVVGRQLNENVAVEGQYEHGFAHKGNDDTTDRLTGNVLVGKRFNSVTPYVVGGLGYEWRDRSDRGIYAVGVGAKYHVSEQVDLDARYRYIDSLESSKRDGEHVVTLGVNVKF